MNITYTIQSIKSVIFNHPITQFILNTIFPPRCIICDQLLHFGEKGIHKSCSRLVEYTGSQVCLHCGRPVTGREEYCFDCSKKSKSKLFLFTQAKAIFIYKGKIKASMYRFKYSNRREYAKFFAGEAVDHYQDWIIRCKIQAIVPVPMYKPKKKLRGYNQAESFAIALGQEFNLPVLKDFVLRSKDTAPMKQLDDEERKNNLKNAFQTSTNIVQYSYILLVDDIYTTGSTADAVTEAILSMGVERVYFLSICIADA